MVLAGKHAEGNNRQMFHCIYLYMYVHIYLYTHTHTYVCITITTKNTATYALQRKNCHVCGLSKKFVQYVYKNFILQILGYINVVPFKILPI